MPKYLIQSADGKRSLIEAVQYLVRAIASSSAQLGKDVSSVEASFNVEGSRYRLTFAKVGPIPQDTDVVIQEQASGGVQSGGS